MQINTWISGSEIELLFKKYLITNYISLRSEWFWTAYHSPSWNKKKTPTLENCGETDILDMQEVQAGSILCMCISPAFTSLIYTKENYFPFLSLHPMLLKIQSWPWRWKMSPSNIVSVTGEWGCGRFGTTDIQGNIYAKGFFLCQTPLMPADFSGVCKHSACQKYIPTSIRISQLYKLLLLLWLWHFTISSRQVKFLTLRCSWWCVWGWVGSTDINHHPCSQQGCCCSPSLEFALGLCSVNSSSMYLYFPRREEKWQCGRNFRITDIPVVPLSHSHNSFQM